LCDLREKPSSLFPVIDPILDQTRRGDIVVPIAHVVGCAQLLFVGDAVEEISSNLRRLLADVFALYVKTKNFHWHISGWHSRDYHLLLDEQATHVFAVLLSFRRVNQFEFSVLVTKNDNFSQHVYGTTATTSFPRPSRCFTSPLYTADA
jgi:hypothetical protein